MTYFSVTKQLTPVFNRPTIREEFTEIQLDSQGLWRPLETLLPKGIPVEIQEVDSNGICKIQTPAYSSTSSLYIQDAFLKRCSKPIKDWKKPSLPPLDIFLSRIDQCVRKKIPYLWGGNAPNGTVSLWNLYFRRASSFKQLSCVQALKGVDCSGLIYWATRGATMRNTSDLIYAGSPVRIRGLSNEVLARSLKPGMLIVWKGHVLVVTREGVVDSFVEEGVRKRPTLDTIHEIRQMRVPVDEWPSLKECPDQQCFVVRDLYPNRDDKIG